MLLTLIKKIIKSTGVVIVILLLSPLLLIFLIYRKYLQSKIAKNRNQRLRHGFNILEPIKIGGLKQWISVRGENKENPLLLVLHGGPGVSMMPFSSIFDSLESHFTIVQWDQRGTGKTYTSNKKSQFLNTMTIEKMQSDALEVVNYLRQRFKKEKIFVLGHSWGSGLGLKLAQDCPELIYAYIGVGQFVNIKMNEKTGYDIALKTAREINNKKAIKDLENLTLFQNNILSNLTMKELAVLRKWQFRFNKLHIKKSTFLSIIIKALCAPEYSLLDYFGLICGVLILPKSKTLFTEIIDISLENKTDFSTAIYIFGGKKDPITPPLPVYNYFKQIEAPHKEFIWFENSGHNLFFEETDKFIKCLLAVHTLTLSKT